MNDELRPPAGTRDSDPTGGHPPDDPPGDPLGARLREALASTRTAPVPPQLLGTTMAAIASERQARGLPPFFAFAGLAAAALVVVAVGASLVRTPGPAVAPTAAPLQPTAGLSTPIPTNGPTAGPTAGASTVPGPVPGRVLGLPVVDANEALALSGGTEIPAAGPLAVRGFLWHVAVEPSACIPLLAISMLERGLVCPEPYLAVTASIPDGTTSRTSLHLWIYPGEAWPTDLARDASADGVPVVVLGHFSDARAVACSVEAREQCARQFVVDAIPWANGGALEPAHVVEASGSATVDVAALGRIAKRAVPGAEPFGVVSAAPARLAELDPVFVGATPPAVTGLATVVRMVTPTGFVSVLVDGETASVFEPPPAFPARVAGVAVLSVSEAQALHQTASWPGASIVAVRGWYSPAPPMGCPFVPGIDALQAGCTAAFQWLTEEPEQLVTMTENSQSAGPPTGPALNPRFVGPSSVIAVPGADYRTFAPIPVVLIGHWSDGRAAYCTPEGATACEEAFVVNGVAWVNGRLLDAVAEGQAAVANLGGPRPTVTAEAAAEMVRAGLPSDTGWTITAMAPVSGDRLDEMDPRTAALTDIDREKISWVVHLVRFGEGPVVPETRTVLVVDGEASPRELPAWPERISAYPRPSISSDPKIPPTVCVGLEPADCAGVVQRMLPVPRAAGRRLVTGYTVGPAHPAWVRWTGDDAALENLRIVAVDYAEPNGEVTRRGLLLAPGRPAVPLPDGALPAWIEWAPVSPG